MLKNLYQTVIISLLISGLAFPAAALPTSYFASESKLASGRWVKVKVTEAGMQELTFDALREMGFEDPSKVAVFGYPSWTMGSYLFDTSLPDDLPAVPSAIYGEKLVFYGEGCLHQYAKRSSIGNTQYFGTAIKRNLDGNHSFYYLTDSREPLTVEVNSTPLNGDGNTVVESLGLFSKDYRDRKPGSDGGGDYSAYLVSPNYAKSGTTIDAYFPGYNATGTIFLSAAFTTFNASTKDVNVMFSFPVSSVSFSPSQAYGTNYDHRSFFYTEDNKVFTYLSKNSTDHYSLNVRMNNYTSIYPEFGLDYVAMAYYRSNTLAVGPQDRLDFRNLTLGQGIAITGASENTRFWNITDTYVPFEMQRTTIDERAGIVADRNYYMSEAGGAMQLVAFDPTRELHTPEFAGEVANQNLHSMEVPDMLLVSSRENLEQAKRLAELHRIYTGTEVAVVDFADVCHEFGSGSRHPMAIRRMAKMLYDRNPEKFQALLIMAPGSRDNTFATSLEDPQVLERTYVPMLQCEDPGVAGTEPTSYGTDAIYGMLADNFVYDRGRSIKFFNGKLDIKVGRIPADNAGQAMDYLDKVEKYLANPSTAPLHNRAIVFPDGGDLNTHLIQGEEIRRIIQNESPATAVYFLPKPLVNVATTGKDDLLKQIKSALYKGVGFWSFMGHSGVTNITGVYSSNSDDNIVNPNPTFTLFSTCATLKIDNTGASLQKHMLFNPTGGMIAGIGANRSVYAEYNHVASKIGTYGFYRQRAGATFGDVYRDGRNMSIDNPGQFDSANSYGKAVNTLSYNFVGDPMLPMRIPEGKVKITAVDGEDVPEALQLNPYENHRFEGAVYTDNGDVDTAFNGTVTFEIYDGNFIENTSISVPHYQQFVEKGVIYPEADVNLDHILLQKVTFAVTNGRFDAPICVAIPTHIGDYNRVNLFAQTSDRLRTSVGTLEGVTISQNYNEDNLDLGCPVISEMYAVDRDFREGDCLPTDFTVYAEVEPSELGFLGDTDGIGSAISLVLDNKKSYPGAQSYFTIDADGVGHFAMPVRSLLDGNHTLTFTIAGINGESDSRSISFSVANVTNGNTVVDKEFCTDQAVIDVIHNQNLETLGRVIVTDPAGHVVFTQEDASFPFTWNLTDHNGDRVAPGIYSAEAYFKADRHHGHAAPARIIVGK